MGNNGPLFGVPKFGESFPFMKKVLSALFLLILVAGGGVVYWGYRDLHAPVSHEKTGHHINIPRGSAPSVVVGKLAAEGIIQHEWPLMIYMKVSGAGSRLKAGEYNFASPITPLAVLRRLEQGEQRLVRLTIPEGWTRWDIASALAKMPELKLRDDDEALGLMDDVSTIRDLDPEAKNLEGYLYPDTYEFPPNTTPRAVIDMMVKRFFLVWSESAKNAPPLTLSPRRIVTMASLIETEAKLESDRSLIASVIYNRLKKEIPLGIDSSIIYASKLAGKWKNDGKVYRSDVERVSPYNTRIFKGLPPGPIASAGAGSLQAALNPAQTNYLYYVRDPSRNDGAHNFYDNDRDFGKGVQALRNWERQRDIENAARRSQQSR